MARDRSAREPQPLVVFGRSVTRRDFLRLSAALAGAAAVPVGLRQSAGAAPGHRGMPAFIRRQAGTGEVVVSIKEGINVQDPTLTGAMSDIAVNSQSYETLVDYQNGQFVPVLAESWSAPDQTTWEFKLRQGVQFHNGEPFNAESVKVTLERWVNPEVAAPMGPILYPAGTVERVDVVDDYTVRVVSAQPFAAMLASLQLTYMMPAQATAAAGTNPIPENIGTGPYRVTEWIKADHITMVPFENYWGEKTAIAKLTYRHVTEDATRMAALRAGEIDILSDITADQAKQLAGDAQFELMTQVTVESLYPVFNVTTPPFNDVKVRQALLYGIDRQAIVETLLGEGAIAQRAPISPEVFAFNDALTPYAYDPDKAMALLKEAGAEGFQATLMVPGDRYPKGRDLAQTIAASADALGVTINVEVPEASVAWESNDDLTKWQMFQWGISAVNADPDFPLRWFFYKGTKDNSATSYSSPEIDRLLDEGLATMDPVQRAAKYKEVQAMLWNDAAVFWQHHVVDIYAVNKRVAGLQLRPDKRASMRGLSVAS